MKGTAPAAHIRTLLAEDPQIAHPYSPSSPRPEQPRPEGTADAMQGGFPPGPPGAGMMPPPPGSRPGGMPGAGQQPPPMQQTPEQQQQMMEEKVRSQSCAAGCTAGRTLVSLAGTATGSDSSSRAAPTLHSHMQGLQGLTAHLLAGFTHDSCVLHQINSSQAPRGVLITSSAALVYLFRSMHQHVWAAVFSLLLCPYSIMPAPAVRARTTCSHAWSSLTGTGG